MSMDPDGPSVREAYVVFQDNLVNDAGTGLPEADSVLGRARRQEVIDFLVDVNRTLEIADASITALNEMVAVERCSDLSTWMAKIGELTSEQW